MNSAECGDTHKMNSYVFHYFLYDENKKREGIADSEDDKRAA